MISIELSSVPSRDFLFSNPDGCYGLNKHLNHLGDLGHNLHCLWQSNEIKNSAGRTTDAAPLQRLTQVPGILLPLDAKTTSILEIPMKNQRL